MSPTRGRRKGPKSKSLHPRTLRTMSRVPSLSSPFLLGFDEIAGFTRSQLDITLEENQIVIRGKQQDDKERQFLHRGIAARQFQRTFVLAEGMQVLGADLKNGLLSIDLARPEPERVVKSIAIKEHETE